MRVLLAGLGMVLLAGCQKKPSETVFLDPALEVLAPSDTTMLAGIRMERVRATAFYKEYVEKSPRLAEFRKTTGLMSDSDVWEYLIASNGQDWVALLRGKFTEMGMEPRVNKPTGQRLTFQGVKILGDEQGAIAFLNPTTAIAGRLGAVRRTIEQRNRNSGIPEALQKLAGQIPSKYEAWIVSVEPSPGFLSAEPLKSARLSFDPTVKELDLEVEASSPQHEKLVNLLPGSRVEGSKIRYKGQVPPVVLNWMLAGEL